MSTDSTDPTRAPGIAGEADTGAPHPQAPEGPDASGTHSAPQVSPPSSHGEDGSDPRRRLVAVRSEVGKAVVGQEAAVTGLVIALLAGGHVLLEGVPGVAKTLLVRSLATALDLETKRIQFTPDLMPGDVTGSLIYDSRSAQFSFRAGPVFTNLLLADEINRTPPKTQSALLEAMEERQVSIDGEPRALPDPFMVIATQNPVEYEGTYPLPEAQLDRFLLKLELPLPSREAEIDIIARHQAGFSPMALAEAGIRPVASATDIQAAHAVASRIEVSPAVMAYLVDLCRATRTSPAVRLGVSPRGATALLRTSRVWAFLQGRGFVTPDDVKTMAPVTLAHRLGLRAEANLEGVTATDVVAGVLAATPVPR